MVVGLIGAGNMAGALARGWSAAAAGPDRVVVVSDVDVERARSLSESTGGSQAKDNRDLAERVDVVVLAMKPAALVPVAEEIRSVVAERALPVVSILGATTTTAVEQAFGPGTPVIRYMPNVAAAVGHGTFCHTAGEHLDPATERDLLDLFGLLGGVPVDERLMEAATAISGCGPAFFALVVEALTDAGVREGLPAPTSERLAVATMQGTAALLRERGGDPVAVRRAVTSPGGVTAAGVAALEQAGVRAGFGNAVRAVVVKAEAAARGAT